MTRPAAQSALFADALRERFGAAVDILASPLLAPRFFTPQIEGAPIKTPFKALIFSSQTGVQGYARLSGQAALAGVTRCWCVGDRTAQAARGLGLQALSAQGDVEALAGAILAAGETGPLLYLHGRETRGDLAKTLCDAGVKTVSAVVYAQEPQPLTPEARALLQGRAPVIAPLFSPRTAQLFQAELVRVAAQSPLGLAPLWLAALSPAVAVAFAPGQAARLAVAARPDTGAMLDALTQLIAADGDA